jgi:hypothetical protein
MRNTLTLTINSGRDYGKRFVITERDPLAAEAFARRCYAVLAASGTDLPTDPSIGLEGIARAALVAFSFAPLDLAASLLSEMLETVEIADPHRRPLNVRKDISDIRTLTQIREAVVEMHLGAMVEAAQPVTGTKAYANRAWLN